MRTALVLLVLLSALTQAQPRRNQPRGKAGEFDYYLVSMSWSPQYCNTPAGTRDRMQCGGTRQYEFVLHGLWPQYERSWPQFCDSSETLPNALVEKMLDIMPSRRLIQHEWEKHGVCAGLSAQVYFERSRTAFQSVKIPGPFMKPKTARTVSPEKIRSEFLAANPGMPKDAVSVGCSGRFLSEVRVCMDKNLKARACSAQVVRQSCSLDEIIVQPIR